MNAIVRHSILRHDISKDSATAVSLPANVLIAPRVVFILYVYIFNRVNRLRALQHVARLSLVLSARHTSSLSLAR